MLDLLELLAANIRTNLAVTCHELTSVLAKHESGAEGEGLKLEKTKKNEIEKRVNDSVKKLFLKRTPQI